MGVIQQKRRRVEQSRSAFLLRSHRVLLLLCSCRMLGSGNIPFTLACVRKLRGLSNEVCFERKHGVLTKDRQKM